MKDRVGLGWRPEISSKILMNLQEIDVVEVIIDNFLNSKSLETLKFLESQVEVMYHGVGLGLASSHEVDQTHLTKLAKFLDKMNPKIWSEHLAFVRAGGIEIGHLAAPPRTDATIDGTLRNIAIVHKTIGSMPHLENIATLIAPPTSSYSEPTWTKQIIKNSGARVLLDLHNLYANAINQGLDPIQFMFQFPLESVDIIHLSGGKWIEHQFNNGIQNTSEHSKRRLLDDHLHSVPNDIFWMLELFATFTNQPVTVIIERDGNYPKFEVLLNEISQARECLKRGRLQN
ncbi:MAG: DUF692 family protein, partial [Proteobacteria bacterium]|nr:DUF692 family protein [Pseudomonadota bacterium]